jgi:hypothetical protein
MCVRTKRLPTGANRRRGNYARWVLAIQANDQCFESIPTNENAGFARCNARRTRVFPTFVALALWIACTEKRSIFKRTRYYACFFPVRIGVSFFVSLQIVLDQLARSSVEEIPYHVDGAKQANRCAKR